jgi:hypothetical protein
MRGILKMAAYVIALLIVLYAYLFDFGLYLIIAFGFTGFLCFKILPELYKMFSLLLNHIRGFT